MTAAAELRAQDYEPWSWAVVIYGRQSRGKFKSISEQLRYGRERADAEKWVIRAVLDEKGQATRYARKARDKWPLLLAMVQAQQVRVVWLWESSRGDRRASQWLTFLDACRDNGVLIYVEADRYLYDLSIRRDWKELANQGVDNEDEGEKIRNRIMRDKNTARQDGRLRGVMGGSPPVGFRNGRDDWVTDPDQAAVLQAIAKGVLEGREIREMFAEQPEIWTVDHRNERLRPASEKMIRNALKRPATGGRLTADGPVVYENPPLDPHLWLQLQTEMRSRTPGRRPAPDSAYALTAPPGEWPLLRCGICGNALSGHSDSYRRASGLVEMTPQYQCRNPHASPPIRQPNPCRRISIRTEHVHRAVKAYLEGWSTTSPGYSGAVKRQHALDEREQALRSDLDRQMRNQARLSMKLDRGWISEDEHDAQAAVTGERIDAIRAELDDLATERAGTGSLPPAKANWDDLTPLGKRQLAREALSEIIVGPGLRGTPKMDLGERIAARIKFVPKR